MLILYTSNNLWKTLRIKSIANYILSVIPEPYNFIVKENYNSTIKKSGISNDSLSRYFTGCFDDTGKMLGLFKTWVCVKCLSIGKCSYGFGDKPKKCSICGNRVYEVGTFQARASKVGSAFEYACLYLLTEHFKIQTKPTFESTKLYDFEVKPDVVIEAKGSPEYIRNPDNTKSVLGRPGMLRTDTEKKAFANAGKWRRNFPSGHFYIMTNALPDSLRAHRDDRVTGIYDVTRKSQLEDFISELSRI